jgi:hypothetical protein
VKLIVLTLTIGLLLAGASQPADAGRRMLPVLHVSTAAELEAAVSTASPGQTIRLANGEYQGVAITRRFSAPLTILGRRAAHLAGIAFFHSANVTLKGVSIMPKGAQRVSVMIRASHGIKLDHILLDGRSEGAGAWIATDPTDSAITIRGSELTHCGESNRCIQPGAKSIKILADDFHDCLDCDFIRGSGGRVVIRGNTFDHAVPGKCHGGEASCNHNNLIQIMGGGPWTISRNRFGDATNGGASVFVSTGRENTAHPIHNVTLASNVFVGSRSGYLGIQVSAAGRPRHVSIINNTILSGRASGVLIVPQWRSLPRKVRPLVANNILALSNGSDCIARTSHNLVERGRPCRGDSLGPAYLNPKYAPTKKSRLLLGKGDPTFTPRRDYFGRRRTARPDIGAIQSRRP